jgi:hypothetical protein
MIGFPIAEAGHVVNVLPPVSVSGGKTGQYFSTKGWDHVSILVMIGAQAGTSTKIFVNAAQDASGTNATAIPFYVYKQETSGASKDTLGARTAVTSAGLTPSGNASIFYVIELDSAELQSAQGDGYPYLTVQVTDSGNVNIWGVVAVLSAGRHAFAGSPTVTA